MKIFRTSAGFDDLYVAAPSRADALRAWGSDNDLFARGAAEEVTDADLVREPLARPGEIIRRSRGSLADQLAALPKDKPTPAPANSKVSRRGTGKPKVWQSPPKPRPSRDGVERAEASAETLAAKHREEMAELAQRETELCRERRSMEARQASEKKSVLRSVDKARAAYERALEKWRKD